MKLYDYCFYRIYNWCARFTWDNDAPFRAFILMAVFTWAHLILLLGIAETLSERRLHPHLSHMQSLILSSLIAVPVYYRFLYRRRYEIVVARFQHENEKQARIRAVVFAAYIPFFFAMNVLTAIMRSRALAHL